MQPELAIGAVVDGDTPEIVRNERLIRALGLCEDDFSEAVKRQLWVAGRPRIPVKDKAAIIVEFEVQSVVRSEQHLGTEGLALSVPNVCLVDARRCRSSKRQRREQIAEPCWRLEWQVPPRQGYHNRRRLSAHRPSQVKCFEQAGPAPIEQLTPGFLRSATRTPGTNLEGGSPHRISETMPCTKDHPLCMAK